MCKKQGCFESYRIYSSRHRCVPRSFDVYLTELISPSYNPPSDYAEVYKEGWELPGGKNNLPCHNKGLKKRDKQ